MKAPPHPNERLLSLLQIAVLISGVSLLAAALTLDWLVSESEPGFGPFQMTLLIVGMIGLALAGISYIRVVRGWVLRLSLEAICLSGPFVLLGVVAAGFTLGLALSGSAEIRGVEQYTVYPIEQVMAGNPLYPNPAVPPFPITQKTPLYYLAVAQVANLFGIVPGEQVAQVYVVGRLLSWTVTLLLAAVVFKTARLYGVGQTVCIALATTAIIIPIPWYTLIRPDALVGFFGVSTIALYGVYLLKPQYPALLVACGVLGFLAFLSKQNGVIFLVTVALFALLRLKLRELIFVGAGAIGALGGTSLLFYPYYSLIPSETNFFYHHIIGGVDNGTSLSLAYEKLYAVYLDQFLPLVALPVGAILYLGIQAKEKGLRTLEPVSLFLALATVVITVAYMVAGLKVGSAINYANEPMIIALLFLARLLTTTPLPPPLLHHAWIKIPATTYWLFFLAWTLAVFWGQYGRHLSASAQTQAQAETITFLRQEFQNHPDTFFYTPAHHLMRPLCVSLFEQSLFPHQLISDPVFERGIINYAPAVQELLKTGRLRYIVVPTDEPLPESLYGAALDRSEFRLVREFPPYDIYVHEPGPQPHNTEGTLE
jgi:hypothetical protein